MRVAILLGWDHAKRAEVKNVEEGFNGRAHRGGGFTVPFA
jgi:hypothetical protein